MSTLRGTRVTVMYDDGATIEIPVTASLNEVRGDLSEALLGDMLAQAFVHFTVAGEDKETWVSLEGVRAIDAETLILADLATTDEQPQETPA